jgi:hypothetical protein
MNKIEEIEHMKSIIDGKGSCMSKISCSDCKRIVLRLDIFPKKDITSIFERSHLCISELDKKEENYVQRRTAIARKCLAALETESTILVLDEPQIILDQNN